MFMMDIKKDDRTYFAHGNEKIVEIDLWHKRFGHVNLQKLKSMWLNELMFRLTCANISANPSNRHISH